MLEARRYRLYLTRDQEARGSAIAGACRALFNAALEQRQTAYRMHGGSPSFADQCRDLTDARRAIEWLADAPAQALQQALRDLDRAFERFFKGQARHPRFRRKGARESFRLPQGRDLAVRRRSRRWGEVRLPKLGWCRFRFTRALDGTVRHATVSRDALGWHVSLCVETPRRPAEPNRGPPVGLDRGVAVAIAGSDGRLYELPGLRPGAGERLRRLRRRAGRQETARRRRPAGERRRSRRQQRTHDQLAKLTAREARSRQDFIHRLTSETAKSHGLIAIEALRVRDMTRSARGTLAKPGRSVHAKAGLNRAILASGWGELKRQLGYKADWYGAALVEVRAAHTSQTCAECGHTDRASRRGRQFVCTACGQRAHADVNAARVILARALEGQEDGGRSRPSQHGEPSSHKAGHGTVNHPEAQAA